MTLAQSLTAIIIFWAIIGGLGASLLLPAMQSLIHGNFEGAAQKKVYALVGAAAAIAAAVGPLIGGFITTYLSWRVAFAARGRRHRGRAVGHRARARRAVHRRPRRRRRRRGPVRRRHGRHRARHPRLAGGRRVRRRADRARRGRARGCSPGWLRRRKRERQAGAARPGLFESKPFRLGISQQMLQQIALGGDDDRAADLPADGARVQRDGGRALARAAVAEHVRRRAARRPPGRASAGRADIIRLGFALLSRRAARADPDRAARRLRLGPRARR